MRLFGQHVQRFRILPSANFFITPEGRCMWPFMSREWYCLPHAKVVKVVHLRVVFEACARIPAFAFPRASCVLHYPGSILCFPIHIHNCSPLLTSDQCFATTCAGPLIGTGMYEPVGQYVTLSLPGTGCPEPLLTPNLCVLSCWK